MSAPRNDCARISAVLALYLDGDIGLDGSAEDTGFEFVCPETLATHLTDCETCQRALQRARRLDAVLAEHAGRAAATIRDHEALFAAVASRAAAMDRDEFDPIVGDGSLGDGSLGDGSLGDGGLGDDIVGAEATVGAGADRDGTGLRRHALSPAVALLVGSLALVVVWNLLMSASRRAPAPGAVIGADLAATAPDTQPPGKQRTGKQRTGAGDLPAETPRIDASNAIVIANRAPGGSGARRWQARDRAAFDGDALLTRFCDHDAATDARIAAVTDLLAASRPGSADSARTLAALVGTFAAGGTGSVASVAFDLARDEPHFVGYLRTTLNRAENRRRALDLDELAALSVAARIGSDELDTAVRRVVRRHATRFDLMPTVAAALRDPVRRHGSAALLLGIWNDHATRRGPIDDGDMARVLFAGQPASVFAEVGAELQRAHSVPTRVLCLLALGWSSNRQDVDALLQWAGAGVRKETYAAAWALSQLPHDWLGDCAARAHRDPAAFVLRAALARARLPAATAWTDPLALTPGERSALAATTLAQFPRMAEWFRDGPRLGRPGLRGTSSGD